MVCSLQAQPLMQESFSYANGPLTNVAAGIWNWHSGSGGALTLDAVDGRAFVNQPDGSGGRDDYNRSIGASYDPAVDNTTQLYLGFTVNFSALPFSSGTATAGSYFAHFKASTVGSEFYARIGANQEGATLDTFRMAIANESWNTDNTVEFPLDLSLDTDYKIIVRLDLSTDQSTLWVNPVDENSTSVTALDPIGWAAGTVIDQFALRQGTSGSTGGPGSLYVDDVRFGTTFESAMVPEPNGLLLLGGLVIFGVHRLRRRS